MSFHQLRLDSEIVKLFGSTGMSGKFYRVLDYTDRELIVRETNPPGEPFTMHESQCYADAECEEYQRVNKVDDDFDGDTDAEALSLRFHPELLKMRGLA